MTGSAYCNKCNTFSDGEDVECRECRSTETTVLSKDNGDGFVISTLTDGQMFFKSFADYKKKEAIFRKLISIAKTNEHDSGGMNYIG